MAPISYTAIALLLFGAPCLAFAAMPSPEAKLGLTAWGAFRCAALAGAAGRVDQQLRLLPVATGAATAFVDLYRAGAIDKSDTDFIPSGLILAIDATSDTMMIVEKIAATASQVALGLMPGGNTPLNADVAFSNQNCALI